MTDRRTLPLLKVTELRTEFGLKNGQSLCAVDGIDLEVYPGEILGLVGESGCGKTVTSLSLLRLIEPPGKISSGEILWKGADLLKLKPEEMRRIRGKEIAMIFQNPQSSLNPIYSIGEQMISVIRLHRPMSKREAREGAIRLLNLVKIPDVKNRIDDYPHQFSGGMCQRIMIAMALSCQPKLLIADEPTASLDVTIQAQILNLLLEIRERFQMAVLLVSHDLGVIAQMCDRIAVMYLGRIVETAEAGELYSYPKHPYTQALLQSVPSPDPSRKGNTVGIEGDLPSPTHLPSGCRFRSRCPEAFEQCKFVDPVLLPINENHHYAACLLYHSADLTV